MPKFQLFFLQIMVTISLDNPHELDEFHQPYTKRLDAENQDDRINLESQRDTFEPVRVLIQPSVCITD